MAADIFIKIGDIKGESADDKHKDEIDIVAWGWGVSQSSSMAGGGGGGVGKASFSDLHFVHSFDKASPNLMKACATGEHIGDAKLTVRKAGKTPQDYLTVTMKKVFITSVTPVGNGSDGGHSENVTLQFESVDLEYKPQKSDGSLDAGVHFKWDIKANKEG